jgi:glutamyl-tRNA(Gln) amidotransferase subunit E
LEQLVEWGVPRDAYIYLLRNNLMPVLVELSDQYSFPPKRLALLYAHLLKSMQGRDPLPFSHQRVSDLLKYAAKNKLAADIIPEMLKVLFDQPNMQFSSVLSVLNFKIVSREEILEQIPLLKSMWTRAKTRGLKRPDAQARWMMGRLRPIALGNIPLAELRQAVDRELSTNYTN